MKMVFYTPAYRNADGFGAASSGFAGAEDETALNKEICPFEIDGLMLLGTYEQCLENIPDEKWQVGIVLLGNVGNENNFIQASENMYVRYIDHSEVQKKIQTFYDEEDAVIFGCAGLKGILDSGLNCLGTGLFMFGEVCTVGGHSDFGNLMLSKLRIIQK